MIRFFLFTAGVGLAVLWLPLSAYAQQFDDKWSNCVSDNDCVIVDICGDAAINKAYVKQWDNSGVGKACLASQRHDPNATARCVENKCAVILSSSEK